MEPLAPLEKTVFITVGSTSFDQLVEVVTSESFTSLLASLGYKRLLIQYGKSWSTFQKAMTRQTSQTSYLIPSLPSSIKIDSYDFKPSLTHDLQEANLVISHAGSGSILESLRLQKKLIVVVNNSLMDNHQSELAIELHSLGYLLNTSMSDLAEAIKSHHDQNFKPFLKHIKETFANILDEEMGFENDKK
ncbi:hypothetical protein G9A89_001707 [Geosiphon pyriformis]|nr:hypothetical protein G9A89_001707 [Geosiphon pyriformis]